MSAKYHNILEYHAQSQDCFFMILDLHLRLPRLHKHLICFNGNKYYFIFQFSDDGAPEKSEQIEK